MGFLMLVGWKGMEINVEKTIQQSYLPLQIPITEQKQKIRQTRGSSINPE